MPAKTYPDNGIIGAGEAMRILDCDRATVHRWRRAGLIKAISQKPGKNGAVLFDRRSVELAAADFKRSGRQRRKSGSLPTYSQD